MDKLAEALVELIKTGTPAAMSVAQSYFRFKILEAVISYVVPSLTVITVASLVLWTIRHCIRLENKDK